MVNKDFDEITIKLRDPDNQLILMLDHIMHIANIGHSYEVVVDPEMSEYKKTFFLDGDGSFYIKEIKHNKRKAKVKDGKLIEGYLNKIQC